MADEKTYTFEELLSELDKEFENVPAEKEYELYQRREKHLLEVISKLGELKGERVLVPLLKMLDFSKMVFDSDDARECAGGNLAADPEHRYGADVRAAAAMALGKIDSSYYITYSLTGVVNSLTKKLFDDGNYVGRSALRPYYSGGGMVRQAALEAILKIHSEIRLSPSQRTLDEIFNSAICPTSEDDAGLLTYRKSALLTIGKYGKGKELSLLKGIADGDIPLTWFQSGGRGGYCVINVPEGVYEGRKFRNKFLQIAKKGCEMIQIKTGFKKLLEREDNNYLHQEISKHLREDMELVYEEVMKHKWFLSEKAGHDVGLDCALQDWVIYREVRK